MRELGNLLSVWEWWIWKSYLFFTINFSFSSTDYPCLKKCNHESEPSQYHTEENSKKKKLQDFFCYIKQVQVSKYEIRVPCWSWISNYCVFNVVIIWILGIFLNVPSWVCWVLTWVFRVATLPSEQEVHHL